MFEAMAHIGDKVQVSEAMANSEDVGKAWEKVEAREKVEAHEVPAIDAVLDAVGHEAAKAAAAAWDEGTATEKSEEVTWLEQISLHLHHIEGRVMQDGFLLHEVMRQFGICLDTFSSPPRGDWGWFLRKVQDIAIHGVRRLTHFYARCEAVSSFTMRAWTVMRLVMEEAFHRALMRTIH